eukprot:982804-Amphidinium_carterae.1
MPNTAEKKQNIVLGNGNLTFGENTSFTGLCAYCTLDGHAFHPNQSDCACDVIQALTGPQQFRFANCELNEKWLLKCMRNHEHSPPAYQIKLPQMSYKRHRIYFLTILHVCMFLSTWRMELQSRRDPGRTIPLRTRSLSLCSCSLAWVLK